MKRILVAGIGNIFHGDDAFGCEVVRRLKQIPVPDEVTITDFGIRSYDLACALTDGYDAVILVDAASRGRPAGSLYLIEPEVNRLTGFEPRAVDAHALDPVSVIPIARSLEGVCPRLYLVSCEPAVLESANGEIGLSQGAQAMVPRAVSMIQSLVQSLLESKPNPDFVPV
jgi:hydrogenase maturation protease